MSKTWIALLRGINVGGKNIVKMAKLRDELMKLGLLEVQTYIQSGNVVFATTGRASKNSLQKQISACLLDKFNVESPVLVLSGSDLLKSLEDNPFAGAGLQPNMVHFYFLFSKPKQVDWPKIEQLAAASERVELGDQALYFAAPDGLARSKLAVAMEKLLGVNATGRNVRTVSKLAEMLPS